MDRLFIALGAASGAIAVAAGAFGAHGLKEKISAPMLAVFETGARYQMYHALALVLLGLFAAARPSGLAHASGWLFVAGTVLFSGSLYGLALGGPKVLGPITPLGGLSLIIGWSLFAAAALKAA